MYQSLKFKSRMLVGGRGHRFKMFVFLLFYFCVNFCFSIEEL